MSDYPGAVDTFSTKVDNVDDVLAAHVNALQAAMVAVQTELGTDPAGSYATVKAWLESLDNKKAINYLINGGFDFAQRQTPGTYTTIATDTYGPDRWRSSVENADLQYKREDGLSESGITSQYFGTYKKITSAGKLAIYQILEGANSVPLRGKTVTWQVQLKASSAKTIRMAVLELQAAGTLDSIPSTLISAWGADGTDPTFGSNLAIITGAEDKSITTNMQQFSVTVDVPSDSKNLICAIWSDSDFAVDDTISMSEAGFYVSDVVQEWVPISVGDEFLRASRYYNKSYNLDTPPGTAAWPGMLDKRFMVTGTVVFTSDFVFFPTIMRSAPTIKIYSPDSGSIDKFSHNGTDKTPYITSGSKMFNIYHAGLTITVGEYWRFHYTAEKEL